MAAMRIAGDTAQVTRVSEGLDQVATFAFYRGSAWIVENQADHFWDPAHARSRCRPALPAGRDPTQSERKLAKENILYVVGTAS